MEPMSVPNPNGFAERREADTEAALRELLTLTQEIVINPRNAEHIATEVIEGREQQHLYIADNRRVIYIPALPEEVGTDCPLGQLWLATDHVVEAQTELEELCAVGAANIMAVDGFGNPTNESDIAGIAALPAVSALDPEGMLPVARTSSHYVAYFDQDSYVPIEQAAAVAYAPYCELGEERSALAAASNYSADVHLSEFEIEQWRSCLEAYRDSLLEQ